jgi:hypothetical protein
MSEEAATAVPEQAAADMSKGARIEAAKAALAQRVERSGGPPPAADAAEPASEPATETPAPPAADPIAARVLGGQADAPRTDEGAGALDGSDPSLARLVEMDQRMRAQEQELRRREEELRQREATLSGPHAERIRQLVDLVGEGTELQAEQALAALDALGVPYESLTQAVVAGKAPVRTEQRLREEWEAKLEEAEKRFQAELERRDEALQQQALERWRIQTEAELSDDARWGLLNDPRVRGSASVSDLVRDYIEADWTAKVSDLQRRLGRPPTEAEMSQHAPLLTAADAADRLEQEYERRVREHTVNGGPGKLARILGLASATPTASTPAEPATTTGDAPPDGPAGVRTLTSEQSSSAPSRAAPKRRDEYREAALRLAAQVTRE